MDKEQAGEPKEDAPDGGSGDATTPSAKASETEQSVTKTDYTSEADRDSQQKNNRIKKPSWFNNWCRFFWRFVLPAFTAVLTLILIFVQTRIYRSQLAEMRKTTLANIKAAKAAKASADAAKESVRESKAYLDFSKETSRLDQRAWVSATEISGFPEIDKPFYITLTFKNSGKTIARKVLSYTMTRFTAGGEPPDFFELTSIFPP